MLGEKIFGTARHSTPVSMPLDGDHQAPQFISLSTHNDNTKYQFSRYPPLIPPPQRILEREDRKVSFPNGLKASIPRKPFPRITGPRLFCRFCDKVPEGFRGEHELQRHQSRAHSSERRKVWICEDRLGDGSFLANCRACENRKRYMADYNAAAQ